LESGGPRPTHIRPLPVPIAPLARRSGAHHAGMATTDVIACLDRWLAVGIEPEARAWLADACARIAGGGAEKTLFLSFSSAARRVGKNDLGLDAAELARAGQACPGWDPSRWSRDQAARSRLLLALPAADPAAWLATLDRLCAAATVEESVAIYQTLPLFPHPERLTGRASEGVRSSMKAVFEAVSLDSPYPARWLDQGAWNQLVLKAFFVGADVDRLQDSRRRANAELTHMLCDYARERRAAKRPIDARLWRLVGWCADAAGRADLEKTVVEGDAAERAEAQLSLATGDH
jgi:hypothetical protein